MEQTEMRTELLVLDKELAPAASKAARIKIRTAKEMQGAAELLTELNRHKDKLTMLKETVTKPLNAALSAARALFKPREDKLNEGITTLRSAMGAYQLEADRQAAIEDAKIAARVAPGRGNLSAETALKKMDEVERPAAELETSAGGSVKFRTDKVLIIDSKTALIGWCVANKQWDLIDVSEKLVLDLLKKGIPVGGAHVEERKTVVNKR